MMKNFKLKLSKYMQNISKSKSFGKFVLIVLLNWFTDHLGTVNSSFDQTSQEGFQCTKAKEYLRAYCSNICILCQAGKAWELYTVTQVVDFYNNHKNPLRWGFHIYAIE